MTDHVLSHPNIPKPLHGVNPRTIMGRAKWDEVRMSAYSSTDHHCYCCGVHKSEAQKYQRLEAHEDYRVDYKRQTVTVQKIIPLCHFCHAFIHSGLLHRRAQGGEIKYSEARQILRHGIKILERDNGRIFSGTKALADMAGIKTDLPTTSEPSRIKWNGWRLVWDGVEYPQKFKTFAAWRKHYQ